MKDIRQTIKDIRPPLKEVAPQTFWFSIGFSFFNIVIGIALYNLSILYTLNLVGIIPIKLWGAIFFFQGVIMLYSLVVNNWHLTRIMHASGILMKSAWWMELVAVTVTGRSAFLLYIWTMLLFLQIIVWIYFTPRVSHGK